MESGSITQLLGEVEAGRTEAFDELITSIYPVLRQIAHARRRQFPSVPTLDTGAIVHEAYERLVRYQDVSWRGRGHFFGAAAQTMRRVLVDYARKGNADKRRGQLVGLTGADSAASESGEEVVDLDDALTRLEQVHPRWVRVIECRYFAGLTLEETAEAVGVSHATVSNDWRLARAWLKREMY
jgi:RNA polymerase sigma factor (TIGR02999 family)